MYVYIYIYLDPPMLFLFLAFSKDQENLVRPIFFGHKNVSLSSVY